MAEEVKKSSMNFKKYLYIGGLIVILVVAAFGILQFIKVKNMYKQAQDFAQKEAQYNEITQSISDQYKTCQGLIAQQEGDFANFEYCKKFINWAQTLPLTLN